MAPGTACINCRPCVAGGPLAMDPGVPCSQRTRSAQATSHGHVCAHKHTHSHPRMRTHIELGNGGQRRLVPRTRVMLRHAMLLPPLCVHAAMHKHMHTNMRTQTRTAVWAHDGGGAALLQTLARSTGLPCLKLPSPPPRPCHCCPRSPSPTCPAYQQAHSPSPDTPAARASGTCAPHLCLEGVQGCQDVHSAHHIPVQVHQGQPAAAAAAARP